ncbi:hypothetical protein [Roseimicrobium gellanilyticum]|nr:hypothetical protein [Roseimicrobium gellanilyticum]
MVATLGVTSNPVFIGGFWESHWAALKYHTVDNAIVTGPLVLSLFFLALGVRNCLQPPRQR